jgi:hypothetical protein
MYVAKNEQPCSLQAINIDHNGFVSFVLRVVLRAAPQLVIIETKKAKPRV